MSRIAKKPRPVKGQKKAKAPPRVSIRTDTLGRRYAINERTGKRIPVARAEKTIAKRKKAIPQNIPRKPKKTRKRPSRDVQKGWGTRREKLSYLAPPQVAPEPPSSAKLIPPGILMMPLEDARRAYETIQERAARYPRVKAAADLAWLKLQADGYARLVALTEGNKPPVMETRRFDQEHGKGTAERIRFEEFARAMGMEDIDDIIDRLTEDGEFSARELYTLYFSPEVA
jgi:hypothetical protein